MPQRSPSLFSEKGLLGSFSGEVILNQSAGGDGVVRQRTAGLSVLLQLPGRSVCSCLHCNWKLRFYDNIFLHTFFFP